MRQPFAISWKGHSLKQLVTQVKESDWRAAQYFNEVAAAHYWNRKPSELGLCAPKDDPEVMMGYYLTVKSMEAYNDYLQQKEIDKIARKNK